MEKQATASKDTAISFVEWLEAGEWRPISGNRWASQLTNDEFIALTLNELFDRFINCK